VKLGDVVVATRVYAYHGGKEDDDGFASRPRVWEAGHGLLQLARHLNQTGEWVRWLPERDRDGPPRLHFKPIAAGEVVLNSRASALAVQLRRTYSDAAAIEMESAGAASAGHLGLLPVLTVRGISDLADGNKYAADASGSQPAAAANAAAFAVALIHQLGSVAAGGKTGPGWLALDEPLKVSWLADLGLPRIAARAALEVHLVPADNSAIPEVRRVNALGGELAALGRSAGLFTAAEGLELPGPAIVASASGSGLAVTSRGQRSAWRPLPSDLLGAVLDEKNVAESLAGFLELLTMIDAPAPARTGIAVGVASRVMLSVDNVASLPRSSARPRTSTEPLRVPAADTLPFGSLLADPADVAGELAARLLLAFGPPTRPASR
jgi:hypothetical protein